MSTPIEDYAIIGDTKTVAVVARNGSIDWWCVPRIDSGAVFAALLGEPDHGRWSIAPDVPATTIERSYAGDSLVLETEFATGDDVVKVIDFMSPGVERPTIFRIVEGLSGSVPMHLELIARFDYGSIVPWAQATGDGLTLVSGSDALRFHSPVRLQADNLSSTADFTVAEGQRYGFSLGWYPTLEEPTLPLDALAALRATKQYWDEWMERCTYEGEWRDDVVRSLITVKALQYAPTGAVCAAATTSLPEQLGGVRNWDYRFSWLRDASLTLQALVQCGFVDEAAAWQQWLQRAVAGDPGDFQIMYGVGGEHRLTEVELDWLPGYENSKPVRIGNEASEQFQLDVFGEIADAGLTAVEADFGADRHLPPHHPRFGGLLPAIMEHLERVWQEPDDGIWEIRGPQRHFTQSKVMAWVAFDRAAKIAERLGRREFPIDRWRTLADQVKAEVCEKGFDTEKNSFVQYYGSDQLDSSLLMLARVGFLPPDDPRIIGTVEAIQRELMVDGFVQRYPTADEHGVDGLPAGEGTFLLTTFWLVDNLALIGRETEARELFERLRSLQNDVGMLSEEYDPTTKRLIGNFPQAFSHLGLIVSASHLSAMHPSPFASRLNSEASP
jgi:GH15 family glucan-1,4-alpha-glucosidase